MEGLGDYAEVNGMTVQVGAVTKGVRAFTTMPYVFTTLGRAQIMIGAQKEQGSYELVTLEPGADLETVKQDIQARLPDSEVLTREEFRSRKRQLLALQHGGRFWIDLGALAGAHRWNRHRITDALCQHKGSFERVCYAARARGIGGLTLFKSSCCKPCLAPWSDTPLAMALTMSIIKLAEDTTLTIVMTPGLALLLFAVTIGMCMLAAVSAIFKVIRIDPAGVFSR